ncbi:LAQU0S07e00496g1_1 [Lachancea quebecensis]|uniref:LAQU0S07e00496g1_1 n=1 Tax=Lachancea quebecensis TaxID=1654605 RepID=A0A0P1KRK5_9SACH|nr:LAQU0S07e00496g1_1 [Lachancea quebecensis]
MVSILPKRPQQLILSPHTHFEVHASGFKPQNGGASRDSGDHVHESTLDRSSHTGSDDEEDESEFPDGGVAAYLALLGSFMGLLPAWGVINSLGAIEGYISKHQLKSDSSSSVSWIFALYLAIVSASCVLTGAYFDRNGGFGAIVFGTALFVTSLMATANCHTIWQFILAFSVLGGVANGILTTPLVSCVATWFSRKRAMATSCATIGGSLGGIIFPLMLKKLYGEVGFPWALRILALVCLACLSFACLFARERVKQKPQAFASKLEMTKFYVLESFNWKYFRDTKYVFTTLGFSLAENSILATSTYIASYAMARGNSEGSSFTLITAGNAMQILGRYIPGYISDRYAGRFNVVIVMTFMAVVVNFAIWLPFGGNPKALWAYYLLYGFFSGSIFSLTAVCIGQISKTRDFGKRYSTAYLLNAMMTLPTIPIAGTIIGEGSVADYNKFIIFSTCLMLAGGLSYSMARFLCAGLRVCKI